MFWLYVFMSNHCFICWFNANVPHVGQLYSFQTVWMPLLYCCKSLLCIYITLFDLCGLAASSDHIVCHDHCRRKNIMWSMLWVKTHLLFSLTIVCLFNHCWQQTPKLVISIGSVGIKSDGFLLFFFFFKKESSVSTKAFCSVQCSTGSQIGSLDDK